MFALQDLRYATRLFHFLIIGALLFGSLDASIAPVAAQPADALIEQCFGSGTDISYHPQTGEVRFVGTESGQPIKQPAVLAASSTPEQAARGYLSSCGAFFGLADEATDLQLKSETASKINRSVIRFQQIVQDIPVFSGEMVVHVNTANDVLMVSGEVLPKIKANLNPSLNQGAAQQIALQTVAESHGVVTDVLLVSEPELWIYSPELVEGRKGAPTLVWRMEVTPLELMPIRELILVDAHSGDIVFDINQIDSFKNRETYTANNTTTRPGTLVCNESDPTCSAGDADAISAHLYSGDTYDFYNTYHSRDSIDNAGMTLISTVHFSSSYCNAFWNGVQMTYGDGCTIVVDDVVAHEMTHGVTEHTSNLVYAFQSGAINESFSDIWGEFIDLTNGHGTDTPDVRWYTGEDVSSGAIRNMKNPTEFGDPDRMGSPNYYLGAADNGGVHWNSGVGNKAAYLITDGDTFNGYTVTGLGITKAAKIYYEAQTNILTSGSDYGDLYNALPQACTNLIGTSGIVASDCVEVQDAVDATEMDYDPTPPAPDNDDFDTPEVVGSLPYNNGQADLFVATVDFDDPVISCYGGTGANTVWYKYTSASSGTVTVNTIGSNYDTVLAVWTGSRGSLIEEACNDDINAINYEYQSRLGFIATAGVTYYIEVAGWGYDTDTLNLNISEMTNDDFNDAIDIALDSSVNLSTIGATSANDDPAISDCNLNAGLATVWYKYTATSNSAVTFNTRGADYDTFIAVWTGSRGSLSPVVCNDDIDLSNAIVQSEVAFRTQNGETYYIEVGQWAGPYGTSSLEVKEK